MQKGCKLWPGTSPGTVDHVQILHAHKYCITQTMAEWKCITTLHLNRFLQSTIQSPMLELLLKALHKLLCKWYVQGNDKLKWNTRKYITVLSKINEYRLLKWNTGLIDIVAVFTFLIRKILQYKIIKEKFQKC